MPNTFDEFLPAFFAIYAKLSFRDYLKKLVSERSGDEASVVDTAIVNPLLELLGFEAHECVYNQQKSGGDRPDFAPCLAGGTTCFIVENKSTTVPLGAKELEQLRRYVLHSGVFYGILTNGILLQAYRFEGQDARPLLLFQLDIVTLIGAWELQQLTKENNRDLEALWTLFCRAEFAEPENLEKEMLVDEATWQAQAKPLGSDSESKGLLTEALRLLVERLFEGARRTLEEHLTQYSQFEKRIALLSDTEAETEQALDTLERLRLEVQRRWRTLATVIGANGADSERIDALLLRAEKDSRAFANPNLLKAAVLEVVQEAIKRKFAGKRGIGENERDQIGKAVDVYGSTVFAYHSRVAQLRQQYEASFQVANDYAVWQSLVQETMLGDLDESGKRDEFALQAAYVVFIRLLLIRVCEDKGIFPNRFLTNGGIEHWQECIRRYWRFASGNPYEPLLDMAYRNAQNIYAHFFTGRELFNWFVLDKPTLIRTLHQLARFNFAEADSDIVGDVYNSYLNRKEKKKRGQYYTPAEIVDYLLDGVGYISGPMIIGANKRLLDPACGSGKFLVTAAKRLVDAYQKTDSTDPASLLERVRASLFGFDLNPFACYLTEVNLLIQTLPLIKAAFDRDKRPPRLERFHVYNVDALTKPSQTYFYAQMGSLMAQEQDEVQRIKGRTSNTPYALGFAYVVGNPPYGASLTDAYKTYLQTDYGSVWHGKPDTYVFFYALAINGRIGFVTPNTFLMGTNTDKLREQMLKSCAIAEIVDLPQGIWDDATVDCVLFLAKREEDEAIRENQIIDVKLLGLKDDLAQLTKKNWQETLVHTQGDWMMDELTDAERLQGKKATFEMPIRFDKLLQQIENACKNASGDILRLGDVTDSSQGIIPYKTKEDGAKNLYIRPQTLVPRGENDWKPLLDTSGHIGRYDLRWGVNKPHLKYGNWLWCDRDSKYFEEPKLLFIRLMNKSINRRLVATYDENKIYNRHNYSNIIQLENSNYKLKYILALLNSSLLNHWYKSRYPDVEISIADIRSLPIVLADAEVQTKIIFWVDALLETNQKLNEWRERGYGIKPAGKKPAQITVPYDMLLTELQTQNQNFPVRTLFDARAGGMFTIPTSCDTSVNISSNVYTPAKFPTTVVLKHNKLWLEVSSDDVRTYLLRYLGLPQWHGKTYDEIQNTALLPDDDAAMTAFFATESARRAEIEALLTQAATLDTQIDERVLDLYGITNPADRTRILGAAPDREEDEDNDNREEAPPS
jgi:type I restriction enzyme M protein